MSKINEIEEAARDHKRVRDAAEAKAEQHGAQGSHGRPAGRVGPLVLATF